MALIGIRDGCARDRCPAAFRRGLFADVARQLDDTSTDRDPGATTTVLLLLDRERGLDLLLSERYCTLKYPDAHHVLDEVARAVRHDGLVPPEGPILRLCAEIEGRVPNTPLYTDLIYERCLYCLAVAQSPQAFDRFRAVFKPPYRKWLADSLWEGVVRALALLRDGRVPTLLQELTRDRLGAIRTSAEAVQG